jgi:hypothetical protein
MTPDEQRRLVRTFAVIALPAMALVSLSGLALRLHALSPDGVFPRALIASFPELHTLLADAAIAVLIALLFGPRIVSDFAARPPRVLVMLASFGALFLAVLIPVVVLVTTTDDGYRTIDPMPLTLGVGAVAAAVAGARRDLATAALGVFGIAAVVVGVMYVVPAVAITPLHQQLITALTVVAFAAAIEPLVLEAPLARAALAAALGLLAMAPFIRWLNAPEDVLRLGILSSLGVPIVLSVAVRGAWLRKRPEAAAAIAAIVLAGPAWALEHMLGAETLWIEDTLAPSGMLHLRVAGILCAAMSLHPAVWHRPIRALTALGLITAGGVTFGWGFIVLGVNGMPTRYPAYQPSFTAWQWVSSAGAFVLVLGCVCAGLIARSARRAPS